MLYIVVETIYMLELYNYGISTHINNLFIYYWCNFWWEWVLLQTILFYVIYQFVKESNFYKLIILLLYFLIISCCILSLLQYELFACFLFLSEFLIFLFYYCCFLILNYSNKLLITHVSVLNYWIVFLIIIFYLILYNNNFIVIIINDLYLISYNLYKIYNNFILNDLIFFFNMFFIYYISLYYFIGLILFILTLLLLYFIFILLFLDLTKNNVLNNKYFLKDTNIFKKSIFNYFKNN